MILYKQTRLGPSVPLSINTIINNKTRLTPAFVYVVLKGSVYRIPSKVVNRLELNHEVRKVCKFCRTINDLRNGEYCETCKALLI